MTHRDLKHLAIIPDGNRRWAKAQGKPSTAGHQYAVEHTLPILLDTIQELEIPYCTLWLMSPENFTRRTAIEIQGLLHLLKWFLHDKFTDLQKRNIRLNLIGDHSALPGGIQKELTHAVDSSQSHTGTVVTLAINYGGRDEILRAIQKINSEKLPVKSLTKELFAQFLDTKGLPDPDLIIRTGGEKRTSGFMLWQSEYAEYTFTDTLFPAFSAEELRQCVADFHARNRRFGK